MIVIKFTYLGDMEKYVAYYRVSTNKQSLGLDAQKTIVRNFTQCDSCIIAEFEEKESGKNDNRPELSKALALCKKKKAILVIAKLDRLSRKVSFVSALMDSGVKFVCADMPTANELTLHLFAAVAQYERKVISQRTKAALAELKKQGKVLGTPSNLTAEARQKGTQAIKAKSIDVSEARHLAKQLRNDSETLQAIADILNAKGYKTPRNGSYSSVQVLRLLA